MSRGVRESVHHPHPAISSQPLLLCLRISLLINSQSIPLDVAVQDDPEFVRFVKKKSILKV